MIKTTMNYKLLQGDALEKLKLLPDNSVDSVVTDPPAGISFMGKEWDDDKGGKQQWINWLSSIFVEVKRVLKPGGHCLVWSIPRTSHWTGTALEDAGFEVRDVLNHVYGSGFPKSLNIGKAVDKKLGNEREVVGNRKLLGTAIHDGGTRPDGADTIDLTKGSSEWEGWGTGLKPACEMWWLVRKPISEKTIVDNVLRWGTGGLNIDGCRIGYVNDSDKESMVRPTTENNPTEYTTNHCKKILQDDKYNLGRFPANFCHDGSDEVMKEFEKAGVSKSTDNIRNNTAEEKFFSGKKPCKSFGFKDEGTPARFFYNTSSNYCLNCENIIEKDIWERLKLYVNNVELSLKTTKAITELIVQKNVVINQNKQFVQDVKSVTNLCQKCVMSIVVGIVGLRMGYIGEKELHHILDYITESKRCTLIQNLVLIVKIWENIDTTPTIQIPSSLYGYVKVVIINYIQEIEKIEQFNYLSIQKDLQKNKSQDCVGSRMIYVSKPSTKERNMGCDELEEKEITNRNGYTTLPDLRMEHQQNRLPSKNNHPTLKSVKLMAYLITLITPKNGIVLDPFMGSGTTGISALLLDHKFIGIEMNEEYIRIADTRIKAFEKYRQFLK